MSAQHRGFQKFHVKLVTLSDFSCVQLLGFADVVTGAIGVCTSVGAAVGFLVGGGAGDYFSIRYPNAARPAINQLSMLFAAPLYAAFLKGLPGLAGSRSISLSVRHSFWFIASAASQGCLSHE